VTIQHPVRPAVPTSRYGSRLAALGALATEHGIDAVVVGVGADLRYLIGHAATPLERLTTLIVSGDAQPVLVVPNIEVELARSSPAVAGGFVHIHSWHEGEDAYGIVPRLVQRRRARPRIAISEGMAARHVLPIRDAVGDVELILATPLTRELRMQKDADELALLRLAAGAADRALERCIRSGLAERSEIEVSRHVRALMIEEGHDETMFAIVASGPNSASPHHLPSDRQITAGDAVVIDIGGSLAGYRSDTTRTVWVAGATGVEPDSGFLAAYDAVLRANVAGVAAVAPGTTCEAVDAATRRVIVDAGLGDAFIHRTGHGIGMDGHEEPYIIAGNHLELRLGMTFSIEPGVYLPQMYGVRIEDIVVCGSRGAELLNRTAKDKVLRIL